MAQARERETTKDQDQPPPPAAAAAAPPVRKGMPSGTGPLEYRRHPKIHLVKQGRVVKGNWVGRVLDRSVRVYFGAQESSLPEPVRAAVLASGVQIGPVTPEELGLKPKLPEMESAIVNLTRSGLTDET